jgi:hypothetical protein
MVLLLSPLGYPAYKSGMFPRSLGVVLVGACASYLVDMLAAFLVPDFGKRHSWLRHHPAGGRGTLDGPIPAP